MILIIIFLTYPKNVKIIKKNLFLFLLIKYLLKIYDPNKPKPKKASNTKDP